MAILTSCPGCGAKSRAPDAAAGQMLSCPNCGEMISVPGAVSPEPAKDDQALLAKAGRELPLVVTSFIHRHLMPEERVVAITRIHPLVLIGPSLVIGFGLLVSLFGIVVGKSEGTFFTLCGCMLAVLGGGLALARLVERLTTEFSCTDRRVLIKSGWLTTQLREMPLSKVEALLMEQGLFGKLFGYGTLVFKGSGGTRRACKNIEEPFDFYRRVQEQVAAAQQHK